MRRLAFIYEQPDWPHFRWDREDLAETLAAVRHKQGVLIGRMEGLGFRLRGEAILKTLTEDVLKTNAIEGEKLDAEQVRSSVARRLGMDIGGLRPKDRYVDGVVEMMLDATRRYDQPLTAERLFGWHAALFPTGRSGMHQINAGTWRDDLSGPMHVVSGPIGRERVHFEAPSARRLPREMKSFFAWFNGKEENDWVVKAALAHLWFVTVHPFDDGNGRIARAIADLALARSEGSAQRFYSMSSRIEEKRREYYDVLKRTQKGSMDVTWWMEWFFRTLDAAMDGAQRTLEAALAKAEFWRSVTHVSLSERQRLVLNRLLDGFEGKLTTSKWAKLAKTSQDTAGRDIAGLIELGILVKNAAGGRSTSYALADRRREEGA
jgi:Fic family protein